jgi:hypothetical protein
MKNEFVGPRLKAGTLDKIAFSPAAADERHRYQPSAATLASQTILPLEGHQPACERYRYNYSLHQRRKKIPRVPSLAQI